MKIRIPKFRIFSKISTQEISSNFKKKIEKCWNWCQKNFIFRGLNMVEYLSDLNEKWMVRKVNFCNFGPVWSRFGKSSISFSFSKYSDPGNFVEFQEIFKNSEIGVRETLFSDDFIWSNICRIYMKSWQWERSNPVVFDLFYSLFVGPFAPDQWAKNNNYIRWNKERYMITRTKIHGNQTSCLAVVNLEIGGVNQKHRFFFFLGV